MSQKKSKRKIKIKMFRTPKSSLGDLLTVLEKKEGN